MRAPNPFLLAGKPKTYPVRARVLHTGTRERIITSTAPQGKTALCKRLKQALRFNSAYSQGCVMYAFTGIVTMRNSIENCPKRIHCRANLGADDQALVVSIIILRIFRRRKLLV
jgi:hypothetical protein